VIGVIWLSVNSWLIQVVWGSSSKIRYWVLAEKRPNVAASYSPGHVLGIPAIPTHFFAFRI